MKKITILFLVLIYSSLSLFSQTTIEGKVTDKKTGEELIGANIIAKKNGVHVSGTSADLDGNYCLKVDPGTYDLEFTYTGYPKQVIKGVIASAGCATKVDIQLDQGIGVLGVEVAVTEYKIPLIKRDETTSGSTVTGEQIRNLPKRNINSVAAATAGSSSANQAAAVSIKGSRSNATDYYIDGVRVSGVMLPESEIEQLQVIQGGLGADYSHPSELKDNSLFPNGRVRIVEEKKQKKKTINPSYNTEEYEPIVENEFLSSMDNPLSTFSIDVDNASYSSSRRFLNHNQMPPKDAVRIEEFINYFSYDYPQPSYLDPFSINTEISDCPWNEDSKLVHIGLQGCIWDKEQLPPSNLVFLLDVSGSMGQQNKLPLLKKAFKLLVEQLDEKDKVSIVVYAGASGLVLPPTAGSEKNKIIAALDNLRSGGGTAGAAGIQLAYETAEKVFIKNGNNRIILATDGDFNIGVRSSSDLVRLIEEKRESGVYLSVLGFGMGNYKDGRMEQLADNGNGNYAYIDNFQEAKKVFGQELGGTLHTIAKDVKLQIEFNPAHVKEYRLVGYENRKLKDEDFNNDKKDAGDLGAGHTVTAIYEIIPTNSSKSLTGNVDDLKYQNRSVKSNAQSNPEWMTIKLRYKKPDGKVSKLIQVTTKDKGLTLDRSSDNFRFSAAVANFAMLLRDSKFKGNSNYDSVLSLAKNSMGKDEFGYRKEFLGLVQKAKSLDNNLTAKK